MNSQNYWPLFILPAMQKRVPTFLFAFLFLSFALVSAPCIRAAIFVVTDTNDTVRITSLRGAIIAANRIGGNNAIFLGQIHDPRRDRPQQNIFRLTISGAEEEAALTGDLDITRDNLTIIGVNPDVTIDASGLGDRVFHVFPKAHLTLQNVTLKNGTAPANNFLDPTNYYKTFGGAIFNSGTLTMQNCSVTGNSSGNGGFYGDYYLLSSPGGEGGGIYNEGYAQLDKCIISGNTTGAGGGPDSFGGASGGGNGAGIYNAGTVILTHCIISNNLSGLGANGGVPGWYGIGTPGALGANGGSGGGIYNVGECSLNFCTINSNGCGDGGKGAGNTGGNGGYGGGIFNFGEANLNTCTISENFCGNGGSGGEGWFGGSGGSGGNGGSGGGIYNSNSMELTSCTVALNQTGAGGNASDSESETTPSSIASGGNGGDGGGILNDVSSANVVIRNTLTALNASNIGGSGGINYVFSDGGIIETAGASGRNGVGLDVAGDFASRGFNLIGTGDWGTGFTNRVSADQVGSNANPINPLLGPLQMNGGFTPTHALLWGSPAIDQGNCFGIHQDQRDHHRPYNYPSIPNAIGGDGSDIGAFELDIH